MRVVAFNCSPRKKGNTATMINVVLEELEKGGTSTELVQVAARKVTSSMTVWRR
jgi:multimeric flavodoxin WrbA